MTIEQRELQIVQAAVTQAFAKHEVFGHYGGFDHFVRVTLPHYTDNMVCSLVSFYAADNITNVTVHVPETWIEHLKETHAPAWLLARWPVQYRTRTIDIKAIWQGYRPPPGADHYGPFLPYVLNIGDDLSRPLDADDVEEWL